MTKLKKIIEKAYSTGKLPNKLTISDFREIEFVYHNLLCGKPTEIINERIKTILDSCGIKTQEKGIGWIVPSSNTSNGVFKYGSYHFVPFRRFTTSEKGQNLKAFSRHLMTDPELGLSTYEKTYSFKDFYEKSHNSKCDIFKCLENQKLYIPAQNELFLYVE